MNDVELWHRWSKSDLSEYWTVAQSIWAVPGTRLPGESPIKNNSFTKQMFLEHFCEIKFSSNNVLFTLATQKTNTNNRTNIYWTEIMHSQHIKNGTLTLQLIVSLRSKLDLFTLLNSQKCSYVLKLSQKVFDELN